MAELLTAFKTQFPMAIWETFYVTVLSTALSLLIGLPLGVLLVAGEKGGVLPLPKPVLSILNIIINLLRSIPFLILMIMVFPLACADRHYRRNHSHNSAACCCRVPVCCKAS